jgi:thiol-disulfide isomerase/thioredoxin
MFSQTGFAGRSEVVTHVQSLQTRLTWNAGDPVFDPGYSYMLFTRLRSNHVPALAMLLLSVVVPTSCSHKESEFAGETPVGSRAPNTAYRMPPRKGKSVNQMGWDLAGGEHNVLQDYKGKVLILDFYATWCVPCRKSIPHLVELQKRYEKDGLEVVGLNVGGPDDQEKVSDFARAFGVQYTLAIPDDDLISFLLSDNGDIPQTFVFDRNGQLMKRFIGYGEATGDDINRIVEDALKSSAD